MSICMGTGRPLIPSALSGPVISKGALPRKEVAPDPVLITGLNADSKSNDCNDYCVLFPCFTGVCIRQIGTRVAVKWLRATNLDLGLA